jgi:DNA polymerase IV
MRLFSLCQYYTLWLPVFSQNSKLALTDLTGINYRYEARLNAAGIYTPLQFLAARQDRLKRQVFHSIVGNQWFSRLRGWEVDNVVWDKKSVGHDYAIGRKTGI